MSAFWIGILVLIPIFGMILILAMCKSAAMADREMDRFRSANYPARQHTYDRIESNKALSETFED